MRRRTLIHAGVDEIQLTLDRHEEVAAWRERDFARRPWAY